MEAAEKHGEDDVDDDDGGEGQDVQQQEGDVQRVDQSEPRQRPTLAAPVPDAVAVLKVKDVGHGEGHPEDQHDDGSLQGEADGEAAVSEERAGNGQATFGADIHQGVGSPPQTQVPQRQNNLGEGRVPDLGQPQGRQQERAQQEHHVVHSQAGQLHAARWSQFTADAHRSGSESSQDADGAENYLHPEEHDHEGPEVIRQVHAQPQVLYQGVGEGPQECNRRMLPRITGGYKYPHVDK